MYKWMTKEKPVALSYCFAVPFPLRRKDHCKSLQSFLTDHLYPLLKHFHPDRSSFLQDDTCLSTGHKNSLNSLMSNHVNDMLWHSNKILLIPWPIFVPRIFVSIFICHLAELCYFVFHFLWKQKVVILSFHIFKNKQTCIWLGGPFQQSVTGFSCTYMYFLFYAGERSSCFHFSLKMFHLSHESGIM